MRARHGARSGNASVKGVESTLNDTEFTAPMPSTETLDFGYADNVQAGRHERLFARGQAALVHCFQRGTAMPQKQKAYSRAAPAITDGSQAPPRGSKHPDPWDQTHLYNT